MMRPRLSDEHTQALAIAAGLANLSINQYLERVIRPLVEADAKERLGRSAFGREDRSTDD
jgi:hypothetical protein